MSMSNLIQNTGSLKISVLSIISRRCMATSCEEIVIPKRIPRGPSDILKALASTIRRDPNAPHYKYHDDPYLIPISTKNKRVFALAQESGRKAAMWVKETHPELFSDIIAEPPIEAYLPKPVYDEFDDLDDTTLLKSIKTASVKDSIALYELMTNNNIPVSEEVKLCLLEMVSFFNENEALAEELIEERLLAQTSDKPSFKKCWKSNGFAMKLFKELPRSGRSYSAVILGMIKYYDIDNAVALYREALTKEVSLSPAVYDDMILTTNVVMEGWEQRLNYAKEILAKMNEQGLTPTIRTLNNFLNFLVWNKLNPNVRSLGLQMIAEARKFGVEPSLASYHFLLNLFCNPRLKDGNRSFILEDILDLIQGKEFFVQHQMDVKFFSTAMDLCRNYYNNSDLAFRVMQLLWHKNNYNFIGTSMQESIYYRNFFITICQGELMETIMANYDFYTPNIYTPEISVLEELINAVTMNGAIDLYSRFWNDIIDYNLFDKEALVNRLLDGMILNRPPITDPPSEDAVKLAETAYSIYTKNEHARSVEAYQFLEWTNTILSRILILCVTARDFEKATNVFQTMLKDERVLLDSPIVDGLELYLDLCIKQNNLQMAMTLLQYCHDNGYGDDVKMASKLVKVEALSPTNKSRLIALFGDVILKEKDETRT